MVTPAQLPIPVLAPRLTESSVYVKVRMSNRRQNPSGEHIRVQDTHKVRVTVIQRVLLIDVHEAGLGWVQGSDSGHPAPLELTDHARSLTTQTKADNVVALHVQHLILLHVIQQLSGTIGHSRQILDGGKVAGLPCQWSVVDRNYIVISAVKVRWTDLFVWREIPVARVAVYQDNQRSTLVEDFRADRLWACHVQFMWVILGLPERAHLRAGEDKKSFPLLITSCKAKT